MAGVSCTHHVLGVPHLLCQLGHAEGTVLLAATRGQGGETHLQRFTRCSAQVHTLLWASRLMPAKACFTSMHAMTKDSSSGQATGHDSQQYVGDWHPP